MMRSIGLVVIAAAGLLLAPAAQAIPFVAFLDGPSEDPPNASPGTGEVELVLDTAGHTLRISGTFGDLIGTTTAAHIHAPTAVPFAGTVGVAVVPPSLPSFPLGVTSGSFDVTLDTLDTSTYAAAFLTAAGGTPLAAEALLLSSLLEGRAYFNIHTTAFGAGEIRGFLVPVPEPAAAGLLALGVAGLLMATRRARA
jgi:hypothetical protein